MSEKKEPVEKEEPEKELSLKELKWKNFVLLSPLGKGSFGEIWMGGLRNEEDEKEVRRRLRKVAIKFEKRKKKKRFWLLREIEILKNLKQENIPNITEVLWYGQENGYNVMAMNVLGESMLDLKNIYQRFSMSTVLSVGIKLLTIVEMIHKCGVIHCDIKPSNLLLTNCKKDFSLIDFGLAKRYIKEDGSHIPYRKKKRGNFSITGTALFCSITTHEGNLSRRDDIESILYVMIYFLKGNLPWQGIRGSTKYEKYRKIYNRKLQTQKSIFDGLDNEFKQYMKHVRKLGFEDEPDYDYLRNLFHYLMIRKKLNFVKEFDWEEEKDFPQDEEEKGMYYVKPNNSFWNWFFS